MPIKSFRGKIADDTQDIVVLHTNNGSTGYKIVKFQIFTSGPGGSGSNAEHTVKVYSMAPPSVTNQVDFSDQTLLAVACMGNHEDAYIYGSSPVIWFDNMIFNQDIYITHKDSHGAVAVNYALELEQVRLDLNENTVATLKDIRNIAGQ